MVSTQQTASYNLLPAMAFCLRQSSTRSFYGAEEINIGTGLTLHFWWAVMRFTGQIARVVVGLEKSVGGYIAI